MDEIDRLVDDLNMRSRVHAGRWRTARSLHQIQLLSCDVSELTAWERPDHCAPFWRLYWHDRTGAEIQVGERVIPLTPGFVALIPPNTRFSSLLRNPVRQFFLHFLVEPAFRAPPNTVFLRRASKEQAALCARIVALLMKDDANLQLSFLGQMLIASELIAVPSELWAERFDDPRITRAVTTIKQAYPRKVGNPTLAEQACLHPSAFIRLFRRCTGHTPLEYLTNLRLEEACTMLHYSEATIDEIADRVGFSDRAYFSRVFGRRLNCAPARYRRLVNVGNRLRP